MNHALFYTWFQIVIDKLGGYSWNRLLASWIDVAEDNLVQETQTVGEIFIEIAGSSIQVRLEDGCYLTVLIQLSDTLCTLINLLWMMSIIR